MEKSNKKTLLIEKFKHQNTFFNDLPAVLKYQILDFLDALSLKKCRLLNKLFLNLINSCEKYNKYWILDVSCWPVTANQAFVQLYMNSGMNFERFIGHTTTFTFIPEFFAKLGKTVKYIENLPFERMDRKTTELMIKTFDKVEDLKLDDNFLLCNMRRWQLVWPSVKRVTILGSRKVKKYEGDYSEFPNVEEINVSFMNLMTKPGIYLVKTCPSKITGIKDKRIVTFFGENFMKSIYKIPDLTLKRLKLRHDDVNKKFLKRQTGIVSYQIHVTVKDEFIQPLPVCINQSNVHSVNVEIKRDTKFDMKWLKNMPNLKKFGLQLRRKFHCDCASCGNVSCFLKTHDVLTYNDVTSLDMNFNSVSEACLKCVRILLKSFPFLIKLRIENFEFDFCHFWKMVHQTLKKTGASKSLTKFTMRTNSDVTDIKINCEDYKYFKVMTHLPNLKELELEMYHKGLSQNSLKAFCDKCPNLKKLVFGIGREFNFQLSGFLIHQLKYLKTLTITDWRSEDEMDPYEEEDLHTEKELDLEIFANVDVIQGLLMVPLKLWYLELSIRCERKDVFQLFEKFPSLKGVTVLEMQGEMPIHHRVARTEYFEDLQKKEADES